MAGDDTDFAGFGQGTMRVRGENFGLSLSFDEGGFG
jgi:hypothetical protein